MKKIKNVGINKKCKKIINELNKTEYGSPILIDITLSVLTLSDVEDIYGAKENFEELLKEIIKDLRDNNSRINFLIERLIEKNNYYVNKFIDLSIEDLDEELEKDASPAVSGFESVSSDMLLFYYISNGLECDDKYELALEHYEEEINRYNRSKYNKKIEEIHIITEDSLERELTKRFDMIVNDEDFIEKQRHNKELTENFCGEDLDDGINIKIRKAILAFFSISFKDLANGIKEVDEKSYLLGMLSKKFFLNFSSKQDEYRDMRIQNTELLLENNRLKEENMFLKNENRIVNKALEELPNKDKEELIKVKKENNFLSSNVEKLNMEVKELKEELESIRSIKENIIVEITKDTEEIVNVYNRESIVIVGGFWNDIEKANVKSKYKADFITAEDTLKYIDRIKNYDIIIFDTSKNSHINFFKIKSLRKLILINKSNLESINDIFEK